MKNKLHKVPKYIKKFYSTHLIGKLIATILLVIAVLLTIWAIPVLKVKRNEIPAFQGKALSTVAEEISIEAGEVLVGDNDNKQLFINTENMNIKVLDKKSGKEWNAIMPKEPLGTELSLLTISYLGEDNNIYEWDSYTYCTMLNTYKMYQIDNGVQIQMHINEGESRRFYEYYPKKLPIERFEVFFMEGLDNLVTTGALKQEEADKYKQTMRLVYKRSLTEECYALAYTGNPPASAVNQMIEVARLLDYTQEMLIEDCDAFGLTFAVVEPASFLITLEVVLDGDDLVVRLPSYEMVSYNSFYTIQNIKVLPGFGATKVADYEDGYIFVPDGAGALFELNTYKPTIPEYKRPVYNNDFYSDYYFAPEYGEELMMPVYGMTYGKDENSRHGFMAIIEEGAETSYIHVRLGSKDKDVGSEYNKVFASFDTCQYSKVKVYGPYSDNNATYLVDSGMMNVDYTVRYKLFPETVTYYDMAMEYQKYLLENNPQMVLSYQGDAKVYLEAVGTVSLTKRFLGVPYYTNYSMTTYRDLIGIIEDLGSRDMVIHYSGVFNEGSRNRMNSDAKLVADNGSREDLKQLMALVGNRKIDMFLEVALSRVYDGGSGFYRKLHAAYDYSNNPVTVYGYLPTIGIADGGKTLRQHYYYIISPHYLNGVVDKFIEASREYDALYIPDLANMYYSDYKFNNVVGPYDAMNILNDNLIKLSQEKKLALYDPFMKYIPYGEYAVEISRESSDYATFAATIPFRQLVMNGLVQFTTENVNMSSYQKEYYILQAVELGAYPKFTITKESEDILKASSYTHYYSTRYDNWKDVIKEVYDECNEVREMIGSGKIVNHTMLMENVYRTDYEGGVSVITNYNLRTVSIGDYTIGPLDYIIEVE